MNDIRLDRPCRDILAVPKTDPPMLAAAAYLAVLAYPDPAKSERFHNLIEAIWGATDKGFDIVRLKRVSEQRPRLQRRDTKKRIDKARRIINGKRLPAALVAGQIYMTEITRGNSGFRISAETRLTRLGTVAGPLSYDNDWDPTLPVMHLAMHLHSHLLSLDATPDLLDLVYAPSWVTEAISRAEITRVSLLQHGVVKAPDNESVKIPQVQLLIES